MKISQQYITKKLQEVQEQSGKSDFYTEVPITPGTPLKCAAVLIPLALSGDEWHLLYTRRTDRVKSHKGQVSFPGGACDEEDITPEQTALREAEEEIGMRREDVWVLGKLNQLVTVTHYRITPVIGIIPFPYAFKVAGAEVARVFTIPLAWLSDRSNFQEFVMKDSERSLITYHPYDGELLWGATARMTVSFLNTLGILQ